MRLSKVRKDKKYLLACSYGPDSMALLGLLYKNKYFFDVAFVNYNLREESDNEEENIKKYCLRHKIKLFIKETNYQEEYGNVEKWAREERYSFFDKLYLENEYDAILIAHNLDDLVETYLIQKKRNSYVSYYGLKEDYYREKVHYIRPLLKYRKIDLLNYDIKYQIPYSIDATNFDNTYLRNDIRNNYVSKLDVTEINQILKEIQLANRIKNNENKILEKYISIDNKIYRTDVFNLFRIYSKFEDLKDKDKNDKDNLSCLVFTKLFYLYLSRFPYLGNFSYKKIQELYIKIKEKTHFVEKITNNYYLILEYGYLKIAYINKNFYYKEEFNSIDDSNVFSFFKNETSATYFLTFKDGLIVKPVKSSDKYFYKDKSNKIYLKKVNNLFTDMKLPYEYRFIYPGVYDKKTMDLVYVPRYQEKVEINEKSVLSFNLDELYKLSKKKEEN